MYCHWFECSSWRWLHIDPVLISGMDQYVAKIDIRCSLKVNPTYTNIGKTTVSTWYVL